MIKNILFDLDGTLLPMDLNKFVKSYFLAIKNHFDCIGYDGDLFIKGLMAGTKAMINNDGSFTNEKVFWKYFTAVTNIDESEIQKQLSDFYALEFPKLHEATEGVSSTMVEAVKILYKKGYNLLVTTNPLFPKVASHERLRWTTLDLSFFSYLTSYENSSFSKPNLKYYEEVLEKNNLNKEECMMVGNDSWEDGIVENINIPVYLVSDYLIHRENQYVDTKWKGTSSDFKQFVEALPFLQGGSDFENC